MIFLGGGGFGDNVGLFFSQKQRSLSHDLVNQMLFGFMGAILRGSW